MIRLNATLSQRFVLNIPSVCFLVRPYNVQVVLICDNRITDRFRKKGAAMLDRGLRINWTSGIGQISHTSMTTSDLFRGLESGDGTSNVNVLTFTEAKHIQTPIHTQAVIMVRISVFHSSKGLQKS